MSIFAILNLNPDTIEQLCSSINQSNVINLPSPA